MQTFNSYSPQAFRAVRRSGAPFVVIVAENVPGKFDTVPRQRRAGRLLVAEADVFLVVTERNRQ